jgi:uncharacterized protein
MASIDRLADDVALDSPTLVEGFPGVGLVGKIAADHLIESFEMTHYANVHCEGIPPVATYQAADGQLMTPVRLYVDADRDLLALQSDIPIGPAAATEFADCVAGWFAEQDVLPVYVSGLPRQSDAEPALSAVGTGDGPRVLADAGIETPTEMGMVSGPTGALLSHAIKHESTAVGLVVESDPQFPDPEAARVVIEAGIAAIADLEVPTDNLIQRAERIRGAREQLMRRMQQASEESSRAQPLRMYQ